MINILLVFLTSWNLSGETGINLTQNYYNQAWQGTEAGSINWLFNMNINAENQLFKNYVFTNQLKLNYGQNYIQNTSTGEWSSPQKSADKIDNESIMKAMLGWAVDPFTAIRFESQFIDESYHDLPRYIHPITITESMGASRKILKRESGELETRLGFALKELYTRTVDTSTMTISGNEVRVDGGLEWVTTGLFKISENLNYELKLRVYKAFFNSQSDELSGTPVEDYWKQPDVNLENTLSLTIIKYLQLNVYFQMIYEREKSSILQIKENTAVGLNIKLF